MGSAYQFHSWRVFVLVCAFPCVAAIAALNSMPESPRFYLEVSRGSAATLVIHRRVEGRTALRGLSCSPPRTANTTKAG